MLYNFNDCNQYYNYKIIEKLYFDALNRNNGNRVLTFEVDITQIDLSILNEVLNWIKSQENNIKLQFKVKERRNSVDQIEEISKFLNSNHILELNYTFESLTLNDSLMKSLRCLTIYEYEDLNNFKIFRSL